MKEGNLHYALLGLIAYRPEGVHGYQLKREVEALCEHGFQISYGYIYRALDCLQGSGELEMFEEIQSGRPNRKIYRVTPRGMEAITDWLVSPVSDDPFPFRDELVMKLLLIDLGDLGRMADLFEQQRAVHMTKLRGVSRRHTVLRKAGLDDALTDLIADAAESRVRAELAWLERVERRILRAV